jgi:hypothetical protein
MTTAEIFYYACQGISAVSLLAVCILMFRFRKYASFSHRICFTLAASNLFFCVMALLPAIVTTQEACNYLLPLKLFGELATLFTVAFVSWMQLYCTQLRISRGYMACFDLRKSYRK